MRLYLRTFQTQLCQPLPDGRGSDALSEPRPSGSGCGRLNGLFHHRPLALLLLAAALFGQGAKGRIAALQEAANQIGAQNLSAAEEALKPLVAQDDPIALNLLGVVRIQQGQTAEAETLFRRAIEKGPNLAGPHVNLARLYGKSRAEDAMAELATALDLAPDLEQATLLLREIAAAAAAERARAGNKEAALGLMLRAHKVLPHDPDLLVETALAAMEAGIYRDAQGFLTEALSIRAAFPRAIYALARAYLGDSKGQLAEAEMRKYLALKPDDATAQYGLGYILMSEQKVEEARAAFEKSLALEPRQTESVFQLGEIASQEGKGELAAEQYAKVLDVDPRHGGALTGLGTLVYRAGKLDEALGYLERAVAAAPSYYKAHYYYALTLKKLGRKEDSDREFQIATGLQKRDAPVARLAEDRK
jgi:tetratricopeptide (TPR) repeat protein